MLSETRRASPCDLVAVRSYPEAMAVFVQLGEDLKRLIVECQSPDDAAQLRRAIAYATLGGNALRVLVSEPYTVGPLRS